MSIALIDIRVKQSHSVSPVGNQAFRLMVDVPKVHQPSGDYYCRVRSASIGLRLDVFGVTPQQAISLALRMAVANITDTLFYDASTPAQAKNKRSTKLGTRRTKQRDQKGT